MTPPAIMAALAAEGIRLTVKAGVLHAGPASRLLSRHREVIAARKDELISELTHPASERERETQVFLEIALDACQGHLATIDRLEKELESARLFGRVQSQIAKEMAKLVTESNRIPTDIFRCIAACCHPDRAPNQQAGAKAMAWLNQQHP